MPNRRSPDRSSVTPIKLLRVPNPVRERALRLEPESSTGSVDEIYRAISMQQVQRMGIEIREAAVEFGKDTAAGWQEQVSALQLAIANLAKHLDEQGHQDLVRILGTAKEAVEDVLHIETPTARQIDVLRLHGDGLLAVQHSSRADVLALEEGLRKAAAVVRSNGSPEAQPAA